MVGERREVAGSRVGLIRFGRFPFGVEPGKPWVGGAPAVAGVINIYLALLHARKEFWVYFTHGEMLLASYKTELSFKGRDAYSFTFDRHHPQ